jgi:YD repeat-containing protein
MKVRKRLSRVLIIAISWVMWSVIAVSNIVAQSNTIKTTASDASTPSALEKGSKGLGTYGGGDFDQVNLFNGNVAFSIPLAALTGRGGMWAGVSLSYNSKVWRMARVEERGAGPWSSSGIYYFPEFGDEDSLAPELAGGWLVSAGRMRGRQTGIGQSTTCFDNKGRADKPQKTLTTLTFSAPDGTNYEFRDDIYDGEPQTLIDCVKAKSRGRSFHAVDGTAATFISDTEIVDSIVSGPIYPSGQVYLRNGERYRVVNGRVKEERDSDGNITRYEYDQRLSHRVSKIIDNLGREIGLEYNVSSTVLMRISFKGIGGASRVITVEGQRLQSVLKRGVVYEPLLKRLFPNEQVVSSVTETRFNPKLVSRVKLPSGHEWRFLYNEYGEVARVETPAGGAMEYEHRAANAEGGVITAGRGLEIFRRVSERRVYPSNNNQMEGKTVYSDPLGGDGDGFTTVREEHFDGNSKVLSQTRHKFVGSAGANLAGGAGVPLGTGYRPWREGKEIKTTELDFNGTALRSTEYVYEQRAAVSWVRNAQGTAVDKLDDQQPENDPRLVRTVTSWMEGGLRSSVIDYEYDEYNNVTKETIKGYDGIILRQTVRTYLRNANGIDYTGLNRQLSNGVELDIHQRGLILSEKVQRFNGAV